MPSFSYTARDRGGLVKSGRIEALNEDEVLTALQAKGLVVTKLLRLDSLAARAARRRVARRLHRGLHATDLLLFCEQLAVLLDAGVPLLKSLEVIAAQVESRRLLKIVDRVREDIEAGRSFHEALARHPKVFSAFWISVVETGEASGHLAQSLNHLVRYLRSSRDLQRKAVTAMVYPTVLAIGVAGATLVFLLYIIPIFSQVFQEIDVPLPLLTTLVMGLSDFTRRNVVVVGGGAALAVYLLWSALRTEQGRWFMDRLLLKLPVFQHLFIMLQLAQFTRGFGSLLESGVPILFSLEIMKKSATNSVYRRAIGEVRDSVREGNTVAEPLEWSGLFPPMMVQMVGVGEEIGDLPKMLNRLADYYETKVATFIERLAILFEPITIGVMAVVVGIFVLAMYLPIFSLAGSLHG